MPEAFECCVTPSIDWLSRAVARVAPLSPLRQAAIFMSSEHSLRLKVIRIVRNLNCAGFWHERARKRGFVRDAQDQLIRSAS